MITTSKLFHYNFTTLEKFRQLADFAVNIFTHQSDKHGSHINVWEPNIKTTSVQWQIPNASMHQSILSRHQCQLCSVPNCSTQVNGYYNIPDTQCNSTHAWGCTHEHILTRLTAPLKLRRNGTIQIWLLLLLLLLLTRLTVYIRSVRLVSREATCTPIIEPCLALTHWPSHLPVVQPLDLVPP